MDKKELEEWHFDFGLCVTRPDQQITEEKCDELMNLIIEWAEKNNLGVGGGYREYKEEE